MDPETFGAWCKSERRALGLTQREIAEILGVSVQTINRAENQGRYGPVLRRAMMAFYLLQDPFERETLAEHPVRWWEMI